jgi:DNA polymerase III alpha subunit (gram-positive type)
MNNKQSSVEKMFQEMLGIQQEGIKLTFDENLALLEKYKAMHKEEIIDAHGTQYDYSFSQIDPKKVTGEQYYKQTFGGNNEQQ